MVGFEQKQVDALELGLDVGRDVAEIRGQGHAHPLGVEDKTNRVSGIVGDGEGADGRYRRSRSTRRPGNTRPPAARWGPPCGWGRLLVRVGGRSGRWRAGIRRRDGLAVRPFVIGFGLVGLAFRTAAAASAWRSAACLRHLLKPLGVGHLAAGGEQAHPGAVRGLGKVHGNAELAGGDGEAVDVVLMLVGDDDGVQGFRVFAGQRHAAEELAAAQPCVDQDPGAAAGDNGAVALGTRCQHRETNHGLRIPRRGVDSRDEEFAVLTQLWRRLGQSVSGSFGAFMIYSPKQRRIAAAGLVMAALVLALLVARPAFVAAADKGGSAATTQWDQTAAARYLDGRQIWWQSWDHSKRDHGTICVSCHTQVPYALARPLLRGTMGEQSPSAAEQTLLANVEKRVRAWDQMEPFYKDATSGPGKSVESRNAESVLNSIILASYDARAGKASELARMAFETCMGAAVEDRP